MPTPSSFAALSSAAVCASLIRVASTLTSATAWYVSRSAAFSGSIAAGSVFTFIPAASSIELSCDPAPLCPSAISTEGSPAITV